MTAPLRRKAPLIITNPTESDSDSGSDEPQIPFSPANGFPNINPPTPIGPGHNGHGSYQSSITPDDVSGSSRSSPAPDTTPPRTPGQAIPPVNIAGDVLDVHLSPKDRLYHTHHHPQDRDPDVHGIGRAPLHVRRPSNEPASTQSPTLPISHHYSNSLSPTDEPRIILATADSEILIKVNITSARSGEAIRELIFSVLQIADEDQFGYSVYQTELGETPMGEALSNDQLFEMCNRSADRKGTLKFIIQRSSPQVYLRPDRALPIPPPPTTVPPLPKGPPQLAPVSTNTFRPGAGNGTRPSPQSQHDTTSSTSERRLDVNNGFDPISDENDGPDVQRRKLPLRTKASYQQLSRPTPALQPHRPSVGIHWVPKNALMKGVSPDHYSPRGLSPMNHSPGGLSNSTSDSSSQGIVNHISQVAPLQIDRHGSITPTPPSIPSGYGVSMSPHNRDGLSHHGRRGSETAAERERQLEWSETQRELAMNQTRRERERRGRDRRDFDRDRERDETQRMRSEETQRWQKQQAMIHEHSGGDSSSPSDTLSPPGWLAGERPEMRSRPGTTGNVAARGVFRDAMVERDRPSTASPILRSQQYQLRGMPPLMPPRPATGSSTSSGTGGRPLDTARPLQPPYRGQLGVQGAQSNTMLETRTVTPAERGQAVPPNWMVGWRAHDGRTTPLQPSHRLPLSAGSKSMNDLRNQYYAGSPANSKAYLKLQTSPRRLPTPSSQRVAPNNYGGPSEYTTAVSSPQYNSPTTVLPYHDQPVSRGGYGPPSRGGQSSGTTTPSEYVSRVPAPWWPDERPRSPQRSPKFSTFRPEMEAREPRTLYTASSGRPENIVRGEHVGSFGQAGENLGSGARAGKSSSDMQPSPLDETPVETTLQPMDHRWILKMFDGDMPEFAVPAPPEGSEESTVLAAGKQQTPKATSPPQAVTDNISVVMPTDDEYDFDESDSGSEGGGTFWQTGKKQRVSKVPSLRRIQTGIPAIPPVPPIPPPEPPYRKASRNVLSPSANVNRHSSFAKRDSITWAFRPAPEDMYERLEEFFPDHDLDKPVIDAAPSGGSSPIQAEHPPTPAFPPQGRTRHKKSIRVVVSDRRSKMGSPTQNMLRKRSTKLWGSRVEEVTPAQAKDGLSAAPDSPPGAPNPKPIFRWVKGELIGKGTYGRVYLALNATTGEMIAVKQVELPRTISDQDDSRQRQVVEALKSESDTLKDLDHPNIVQYLGFEQSTEFLSIFLEYVPGGSIGGCLRKQGKFDHDVVRSFTSQMLAGLEYLHSRGILHRDMKADNILLDPSGVCKISDFGISKRAGNVYSNDAQFTAMQGSIFWMAPEVLHNNNQGYNAKIDIWSLGCVVLEMWAGRRPWNQEDIVAVMFKLGASREAPPVPDDVVLDEVEDDFRRQCFAVNPNDRPTAAELRKHKFLELKPGWVFTGFT